MNLESKSSPLQLVINILYYSFISALSGLVFYVIFYGLNEVMNSYYANRLSIMEMEYKLKSFSADVLSNVQNTLKQPSPSPAKSDWGTWLKPVVVSLATLSVRYLVSLCCHMLPTALFKISLLGPCLKFIILGPEGFFVDQLDPSEIEDRFKNLREAGQTLSTNCQERSHNTIGAISLMRAIIEDMRSRICALESGSSIDAINLNRPITHEERMNEVSRLFEGISGD